MSKSNAKDENIQKRRVEVTVPDANNDNNSPNDSSMQIINDIQSDNQIQPDNQIQHAEQVNQVGQANQMDQQPEQANQDGPKQVDQMNQMNVEQANQVMQALQTNQHGNYSLQKQCDYSDRLPEMPIGVQNEINQSVTSPLDPNEIVSKDCSNQYYNAYVNNGINIIEPSTYSPMVYVVDNQKMVYSNDYTFVYDINNQPQKKKSLPYAYVSRNSFEKPDFNIFQNKLKLYNYWIETSNIKQTEFKIIQMFGAENIFNTKSLFFRKKNSYMGEKVILISKIPQKPYKFINRINRTFSKERRTIKSVLGDYILSPDCLFIILAERSIEYICNNYYRYHKNERTRIETLINSFKSKFTCITENDIN